MSELKNAARADMNSIRGLIETVRALTELMAEETDLLRALQIKNFSALQEQKLALIRSYEESSAQLREDPSFAQTLEPRLRAELKDVNARMHDVMHENEVAILAAREMNQRAASAIVEAVGTLRSDGSTYSGQGSYAKDKATPPLSVQIDGKF
jgi:hypothetical protein